MKYYDVIPEGFSEEDNEKLLAIGFRVKDENYRFYIAEWNDNNYAKVITLSGGYGEDGLEVKLEINYYEDGEPTLDKHYFSSVQNFLDEWVEGEVFNLYT